MEYIKKKINLLDNKSNQLTKFWSKNWVGSRRVCNIYSQIKFKTSMLKSSLCDYSIYL